MMSSWSHLRPFRHQGLGQRPASHRLITSRNFSHGRQRSRQAMRRIDWVMRMLQLRFCGPSPVRRRSHSNTAPLRLRPLRLPRVRYTRRVFTAASPTPAPTYGTRRTRHLAAFKFSELPVGQSLGLVLFLPASVPPPVYETHTIRSYR